MSEEGFWIYKNGRRIFIRGKRYTNSKNISNKPKYRLYDKRLKQIVKDESPYYDKKLRVAEKQNYSDKIINTLKEKTSNLSSEYLELFRKNKLYKIKHKIK